MLCHIISLLLKIRTQISIISNLLIVFVSFKYKNANKIWKPLNVYNKLENKYTNNNTKYKMEYDAQET